MRKFIMTVIAAVACPLALMGCGGDGDGSGSTSTRADEGIWSYISSADQNGSQELVQTVVLSDGSYWGVYGDISGGYFSRSGILYGTASINGDNASGTYIDFGNGAVVNSAINGTYTGTVSAKNSLNLTFTETPNPALYYISSLSSNSFNMSYDGIYNQPASLSSIAGNYQQAIPSNMLHPVVPSQTAPTIAITQNLSISGSNLTVVESDNGKVLMNGTITPHGAVNVFDVSLTTTADAATAPFIPSIPADITYKGILFQTSGVLKNDIEIVAASGNNQFFYIGSK